MQKDKKKLIRSTTVPCSLDSFCCGLLAELKTDYDVVALSSPGPEMQTIAQREGVRTIAVSMERHISPLKDLVSLFRLIAVLIKEKPHVIHSMTPKAGLLCMMAAWIARVPVRIHTFTGLVFPTSTGLKRRILMLTDALTCACATNVIAEGQGVRNDLVNHHITRKNPVVLGHGNVRGIDLEHYQLTSELQANAQSIRQELGIAEGDIVFLAVGRLVSDKGITELVDAFVQVLNTNPNVHIILVGREEPELDPLRPETVSTIMMCPNIHTVGEQSDVRPYYGAATALVHASYREGFPNVVIEAGAMQLPCIVTDINGSREIIINNRNGIIVPPRNTEALHTAMLRYTTDTALRQQHAMEARPLIAQRFEQGYVRQCLKEYYKKIITQ